MLIDKTSKMAEQIPYQIRKKTKETSKGTFRKNKKDVDTLLRAARAWDSMRQFRQDRERCKRYMYGDQWSDIDPETGLKEEDLLRKKGEDPKKQNLIRRLAKVVIGTYRNQNKKPVCSSRDREEGIIGETMSALLECNIDLNEKKELDACMFEEFLISGMAVQKETYGTRDRQTDCWTDNVNPAFFFIEGPMNDVRMRDVEMAGELHDVSIETIYTMFAKNEHDLQRITAIYGDQARFADPARFAGQRDWSFDFLTPADSCLHRVIEVWTKQTRRSIRCHDWLTGEYYIDDYENLPSVIAVNQKRHADNIRTREDGTPMIDQEGNPMRFMPEDEVPVIEYEMCYDRYWHYQFLSPYGDVLEEGDSPYKHGSHPYTVRVYPFVDGEAHSFTKDIIDQQKYFNEYIMLNNYIIKSSAKGALIVDKASIPDDSSIQKIADAWAMPDSVIPLELSNGQQPPQQVMNAAKVQGLSEMVQMQRSLMEEVSGVHAALQGKPGNSGMSGTLYSMQAQNASTSVADLLFAYDAFLRDGFIKKLKNIQQFYDEPRIVKIAGRSSVVKYDPATYGGIEFDIAISNNADSPLYRASNNEFLYNLVLSGKIELEDALRVGYFQNSEYLLQLIEARKNEQQQQAMQQQAMQQQAMQQQAMQQQPQTAAEA